MRCSKPGPSSPRGAANAGAAVTVRSAMTTKARNCAVVGQRMGKPLLTQEQHAELGTTGGGVTSYGRYDARGHAHERVSGGYTLEFDFDGEERLEQVTDASTHVVLKQFVYDDANGVSFPQCAGGICRGKLVSSARTNPFADLGAISVTESVTFDSATGLP